MKIKVLDSTSRPGRPSFFYCEGYEFVKDSSCLDYDWLVVYDEMPSENCGSFHDGYEPLRCPCERTILATWEPVSIKRYGMIYSRQFGHLLTNRPSSAEQHPHYHLGRGYFNWFTGRSYEDEFAFRASEKVKLISAVCSNKCMRHTKHAARIRLLETLQREIPELEWYGRGVRAFREKCDVMDAYKYHVAIENHIGVHHWSEKLADAFLCECLPFYAGDPAIFEVFPEKSIIPIPIDDPAEASRIVRAAIANGEYEKRREAVLEAKRLILTKYNFWAQVIEVIESSRDQPVTPVDPESPVRLYSRKELRKRSMKVAIADGWGHLLQAIGL